MNLTGPEKVNLTTRDLRRVMAAPPSSFTGSTRLSSKNSTKKEEGSKLSSHFTAPSERCKGSTTCSGGSCCDGGSMCSRLARVEKQLVAEHEQQRLTHEELARASRELRLLREVLQRRAAGPPVPLPVVDNASRITKTESTKSKKTV